MILDDFLINFRITSETAARIMNVTFLNNYKLQKWKIIPILWQKRLFLQILVEGAAVNCVVVPVSQRDSHIYIL